MCLRLVNVFRCRTTFKVLTPKVHIPAKFRENWQSGSDQTEEWYSLQKRLVFCPFLWSFWSDIAKNFTGSRFSRSPFPPLCQVLSKSVQFSKKYIRRQ